MLKKRIFAWMLAALLPMMASAADKLVEAVVDGIK